MTSASDIHGTRTRVHSLVLSRCCSIRSSKRPGPAARQPNCRHTEDHAAITHETVEEHVDVSQLDLRPGGGCHRIPCRCDRVQDLPEFISPNLLYLTPGCLTFSLSAATRFVCWSSGAFTASLPGVSRASGGCQSRRTYAAARPHTSASRLSISGLSFSASAPRRYAPGPKAALCATDDGNSSARWGRRTWRKYPNVLFHWSSSVASGC